MDNIKYISDLIKNDKYLKDKSIVVKQEGDNLVIRWQDPLIDELANPAIPDEKISKDTLNILRRVAKIRPALINKFLKGDGQNEG